MRTEPIRILILEDNEAVLKVLKDTIATELTGTQVAIEQTTEHLADLMNISPNGYDVILLDYVCLSGGNFHEAPLEHFGLNKVISMSSSDQFNELAQKRGVTTIVKKPLQVSDLSAFAKDIIKAIDRIVPKDRPRRDDNFVSGAEAVKKSRERDLVEKFLHRTQDFAGWKFAVYDENPDLIYEKNGQQLGFESIIVAADHAIVDCYFNADMCQLTAPALDTATDLARVREALVANVLNHLRHYKIPTVIVVSIIGSTLPLSTIAEHLRLPEMSSSNIRDYYMHRGDEVYKIPEPEKL